MKITKRILSVVLSTAMTLSVMVVQPDFAVMAQESEGAITLFNYEFAYSTPGYADGTIYINAAEDGVYKVFWGDKDGEKLTKAGVPYSYLARVIVKDGKGSFNIINDYTAIPENAATVLVYKKDKLEYTYDIPEDKMFVPGENSYTFGSISDPHFTRYSSVSEDDAVPAMDKAMDFLDKAGIDFVAMSGDLSQAGEQLAFDRYNEALAKHPDMTVLTAIGNHDSRTTLSTSNKDLLDTSISRWYNSITSKYFTVDEEGNIDNKLKGHEILATDALTNPIETVYKESKDGEEIKTSVPGLDFVTEAGGNIFIFFNDIAKTGETYDTDKLVTTGQMDWLQEQLEKYKDKKVFLYQHYYLCVNTLDNDVKDYNNCTGDLKNAGGYSYDLDYKDVVTTSDGKNLQTLLNGYQNTTLVTGHSHWQYSMQSFNKNINFGRLAGGDGATMIHLSSVTEPRYIGENDPIRTSLNGYASEGATVTTYDDCIVYNNIDFTNEQYEAYATYLVPSGNDSKYQPVKNQDYKESTTEITGDKYLEAEDLTEVQLLNSDFNLLKGAAYTYSSRGTENTDTALTDGASRGTFYNSKWGAKSNQRVTIVTDGVQSVDNLKCFMLYYVSDATASKKFNIELSLDGENFEKVYESPEDYTYTDTTLNVDTSNVELKEYKYVRLNLLDGPKDYGYQIRELAAIGYARNTTPNTAESASSRDEDAEIDESEYLDTDYNLTYGADYTQSSVGSENKEGALTDGKVSTGFANTERSSNAKKQEFVIDLGKGNEQEVSNIDYLLLYSANALTYASDWEASVSLDGECYETIGKYSNVESDQEHFDVDLSNVALEKFRYVKLNIIDGKTDYGYQFKEFAVIGIAPVEYPEIPDQSESVADEDKNLALNKDVYVSSTYSKEGTDPKVLTDGKTDKYWSSDWDDTRTSDYVIIDLGEEKDAAEIGKVLVNYKAANTFCDNYAIEVSKTFDEENPDDGFYEIGKTKAMSWELLQKKADPNGYVVTEISDVASDMIRYVKVNMNGHAAYGFQLYEIAVIKKEKAVTNNLEKAVVSGESEFTYTGKKIETQVNVELDGKVLTEGIDYTVTYDNNINAGTAIATITGIGDYIGSTTYTYEIKPADISSAKVTPAMVNDELQISVSVKGITLVENKDYKVSVSKDKYAVNYVVEGIGNYADKASGRMLDINGCDVAIVETACIYNGKPIEKEFYVLDDNRRQLEKDADYTFEYKNNVNAGQGEIVIEGKGIYFGTRTEKFDIFPMQITGDNISVDYSQVKASYEFIGKDITPIIRLKCNGEILNPMVDYTVEYKNNFYPGKAGIIIKGIDNYSGEIVKEFEIVKKEIKNVTIRTEFNGNKELVITVNNGSWGMTKGVDYDYTVTTDDKGNITITFTGLGKNYTGTTVKVIPADENPNTPAIIATTESIRIGKATIKNAKNLKGKKVKLSWKKILKVNGYNVRYALSKKKLKKAKIKTVKKNTPKYIIKKLKKKKYYVQVRGYSIVDGRKCYGEWSKVKKVTVKK